MEFRQFALPLLYRKIVSASISSCLFALIFALIFPDPFNEKLYSYMNNVIFWTPIYLMYAAPFIFIYGTGTSFLSEFIVWKKEQKKPFQTEKKKLIVLAALHVLFGMIFLYISLIAAIIFFLTDLWLRRKNKQYTGQNAFLSLLIPLAFFGIFIGFNWLIESFS